MRIYDTPDGDVLDETPLAPDQTTIQGQKSLTELLDEIEQRARDATTGKYEAVKRLSDVDVPALVKALRVALEQLDHAQAVKWLNTTEAQNGESLNS